MTLNRKVSHFQDLQLKKIMKKKQCLNRTYKTLTNSYWNQSPMNSSILNRKMYYKQLAVKNKETKINHF